MAVSHVGVEVDTLRECMRSEEAAAASFTLRQKYRNRVRAPCFPWRRAFQRLHVAAHALSRLLRATLAREAVLTLSLPWFVR